MKAKICISILLLVLVGAQTVFSQPRRKIRELRNVYKAPEEMISLSRTMTFPQALELFNDLSQKFLGKIVVDPDGRTFPIGEDIDKMHWLDAMEQILRQHNLWYDEYEDYIQIVSMMEEGSDGIKLSAEQKKLLAEFDSREVIINAIFFESNVTKIREAGMSWNIFRDGDINATASMTAADNKTGVFQLDLAPDVDFADILATFKALESDNLGEILSNPLVTVKSGIEGRVQIGVDVSTTVQDFSGNTVTQFISTGAIIKVKPFIIRRDSIDFIVLDLDVERSSSRTGDTGLEILKTQAKTTIMMLDGEETIIGGLYSDDVSTEQSGIPFLKDLPWWFLGLRYVFGYESKKITKKDLLIVLKADLLPSLADRYDLRFERKNDLLKNYHKAMKRKIEYYKKQTR
jgi:type IV pilus assembly protein PilQ